MTEEEKVSDFYTEQLIKKQTGFKDTLKKAGLIALAVASLFLGAFIPFGMLISILIIVFVCAMFMRMDVEYEYLFVNGDLDVDKIMHKSKRKRIFSTDAEEMALLAPENDPKLGEYRNVKVLDVSSGAEHARRYALVTVHNGETIKLIFEPNDTIIEGMFLKAPRKVVRR